jgi:hypothetical protein
METFIYNIDSRTRNTTLYPNNSKFKYDFATNNNSGKLKNVIELKISSIEFPNTSHFFNAATYGNTTFTIDGTTITIADGNYNSDDLMTAINDALPSGDSIALDKNTGKVTITTGSSKDFDFSNTTDYYSLGFLLGFKNNTYTINTTQESENLPNCIGEQYFLLKINDYGYIENNGKKYMSKIIMTSPKYEMTFDSRNSYVTKTYKFHQPTDIRTLDIEIVDYLGNNISLNGAQFSFTLEATVVHNSLLKKYHELSFHSGELLELMLHDNMLEFYDRENKDSKNQNNFFDHSTVNNPLLSQMNSNNIQYQRKLSSNVNMNNVQGIINNSNFTNFNDDKKNNFNYD